MFGKSNIVIAGVIIVILAVVGGAYISVLTGGDDEDQMVGWADPDDKELVARGKTVYADTCAACHGENLEGQPNWRVRTEEGLLPAPPHDVTGHTWHHPDPLLFKITKYGGQKNAPEGFTSGMPEFSEILSDAEIVAVLAFIKSNWPEDIRKRHAQLNERMKANQQ